MQVANVTTPAQYFHVLRRQMRDSRRQPLVIMTPKSLLRHPKVFSSQNDFVDGKFRELIDDAAITNSAGVKRIVLCSGKVYYDLLAEQALRPINAIAIVRLEQLYPFASDQVDALLERYSHAKEIVWTQEEPKNMGGWSFVQPCLNELLKDGQRLTYAGRKASAATATGSLKVHQAEQDALVKAALTM
jgi:2-oxoglutarate dehydrogenase complex dehydrogenase (E1) component-like enzyme